MSAQGFIRVTLQVWEEDDQYVGLCPELGTSTCGDTVGETFDSLKEAVLLHLNTLEDVGECQRFLRENGIKFYKRMPSRVYTEPRLIQDKMISEKRFVQVPC